MVNETTSKAYVVLGATSGVGEALIPRLQEQGAQLLLGGRNRDRLAELESSTGLGTARAEAEEPASITACITRAREEFGRLDGMVNLMGTLLLKPAHLTTLEEWETTLSVNLTSSFVALQAAARAMTPGGGSIVFVSSAAARTGLANHEAIAAAKAGILGLTRSAAATYGHRGIRVNAVAPGLVRTPLTERITGSERALEGSTRMHVLGRIGEAEDVASAIAWLLDPGQSWITGQVIGVDGGLSTVRSRG